MESETDVDGHHHEGTELSGQLRVSRRGRNGPEGEVVGTGQPPTQAAISRLAPPGDLGSARLWPASEPFCCLSDGDRGGDRPPSSPQMLGVSLRYVLRSLSQNLGLIPCTWPWKLSWDLSLTPGHFPVFLAQPSKQCEFLHQAFGLAELTMSSVCTRVRKSTHAHCLHTQAPHMTHHRYNTQ